MGILANVKVDVCEEIDSRLDDITYGFDVGVIYLAELMVTENEAIIIVADIIIITKVSTTIFLVLVDLLNIFVIGICDHGSYLNYRKSTTKLKDKINF